MISIAYSFPETQTRIQAHQIITKVQVLDFMFKDTVDYSELMESWFSKCKKVIVSIEKIEDENCRSYIFEYFFKFLSYRFARDSVNKSLIRWVAGSQFDRLIYYIFLKSAFLSQDLFDYMSEALANLILVPEILQKFDFILLLNIYESLYTGDKKRLKPSNVVYVIGIIYSILSKFNFSFELVADAQLAYKRNESLDDMQDFNAESKYNRLFVAGNSTQLSRSPKKEGENLDKDIQKSMNLNESGQMTATARFNNQSLDSLGFSAQAARYNKLSKESLFDPENGSQLGQSASHSSPAGGNYNIPLATFQVLQMKFLDKLVVMTNGNICGGTPNSIVKFILRILQYCLRNINFRALYATNETLTKSREKEHFRYLLLLVDLSATKSNHFVLMNPFLVRDISTFILSSDSEDTTYYHRAFDCKLLLTSDIINMTRKSYFLEFYSLDNVMKLLEHVRTQKPELFVRFAPIVYLHCVN